MRKVLSKVGIAIRDSNLQFRDMQDVIADVAAKWGTLTDVEKNAITTAMAGCTSNDIFNRVNKYRKKPVEIEAIQYRVNNLDKIKEFCPDVIHIEDANLLQIRTLEGVFNILPNDYIIRGVNGEFYPCKPDIFNKTYEFVG